MLFQSLLQNSNLMTYLTWVKIWSFTTWITLELLLVQQIFTQTNNFNTCRYFKNFKTGLMLRFQDFELSIDINILILLATFSKNWAKCYSIFWSHWQSNWELEPLQLSGKVRENKSK
jgi:hypothetical protein